MQNADIARRFDELAELLDEESDNPHRVRAYRRAAEVLRRLERPVTELLAEGGPPALETLRGIGPKLSRAIASVVKLGRLPMLDRMRRKLEPAAILRTVPGIGHVTSNRLSDELGIKTLEDLEVAAHDGRLANIMGLPLKTIQGVIDSLAGRLARLYDRDCTPAPDAPVEELLDVDREYRTLARAGLLKTITPRRFNPTNLKWLPILHTRRGDRLYTALYSNTARAHQLERTGDWVILYYGGRQATVVTETAGDLKGLRVVRGREAECAGIVQTPLRLVHSSGKQ